MGRRVRAEETGAARGLAREHARHMFVAALTAALLALTLVGCAGIGANTQPITAPTATEAASTSLAGTPAATTTIGPTPVQITDLNTFRAKLADAFQSNTWAKVAPLLSPAFSFQGLNSGGASLEMPDSASDLQNLYTGGGPWSQSAQYEVNIHYCYAGSTPTGQQMGFDGGSGNFILAGIERWQGYWVIAWAFQDPLGGSDACANG
ncbi:MAG TPA: hypothetical protein VKT52_08815 [Ktedonobacterales bacterium]|nr:hypothetical protein [Ktedonobacterales bacterium]